MTTLSQQTADAIFARADELGLTNAAIAERMDITPDAVRQWRVGLRSPGLDVMRRLAEAVDADLLVRVRPRRRR